MTVFWQRMVYGCDSGIREHDVAFYLEVGCEGPRDREIPLVLPPNHPVSPGKVVTTHATEDGRQVVPVPFIAGVCRICREEPCARCEEKRTPCSVSHVRWAEDYTFELERPTQHPREAGCFRYPSRAERRRLGDRACGRPIFPQDHDREEAG